MGDLTRKNVPYPSRMELLSVLEGLKELTVAEACEVLKLNARRYYRWRTEPHPPAVKQAWNRITPEEEGAVLTAAGDEALVDLRASDLMVYGHDSGKFFLSISTIQRVLKRNDLQAPYTVPRRKRPAKPDIRDLMTRPGRIISYDATEFYLVNRLRVVVIVMLDLGSRKFIHFGVRIASFTQKDIMNIWDEALWKEGIDTSELTALSDRGSQMKGSRTKAHLIGKWNIRLEFARPYTPDDNAWVEAFIKYLKYHPECPDFFETVQDVMDWVTKFQALYNDHPHSSLGYVRPNDEHAGRGDVIRETRRGNQKRAIAKRHTYYKSKKEGVLDYGLTENRGSNEILEPVFVEEPAENAGIDKITASKEAERRDDFRVTSESVLCQNRA